MALRLFLARHGQVPSNREFRYVGDRDEELTEQGRTQADGLAAALAELPLAEVISSPLARCRETAQRIATAAGIPLRTDARIKEQSFGTWEGMSRAEVMARSDADRQRLEAWETDPEVSPPEGESLASVQIRALDLVEELAAGSLGPAIVLVSHVGPIKSLLASALDLRVDQVRRLFLDPATISVIDWGEPPFVRLCNSHAHLGWAQARWMKN